VLLRVDQPVENLDDLVPVEAGQSGGLHGGLETGPTWRSSCSRTSAESSGETKAPLPATAVM
jgi:hypothetical protein